MEMNAVVVTDRGATDTLSMARVVVPNIDDDEVLVRIRAIGVGVHDRWFIPADARYPYPIGIEGVGIVERIGSAVHGFSEGARVMFVNSGQVKGGVWAEFSAVPGRALVPVPDAMEDQCAAALPVAGGTALASMRLLNLQPGERLFIAGASGAIGTLAVQLAISQGCRVAASASPGNHDYLHALGAELAVDYRAADWIEQTRQWASGGVDAALAIQPGTGTDSMHAVRDGGRVVTVSGDQVTAARGIDVQQVIVQTTNEELAWLANEVVQGRVTVEVQRTYPFANALNALKSTETRHARGKTVILLQE